MSAGIYKLVCEQAGLIGNAYFGAILPVDNVSGLAVATLTDVLIQGGDEENDEDYRARYYKTVNARAFAGNRAAYEQEIITMPGVGGVHAFRRPEAGVYVTCVICGTDMGVASDELSPPYRTRSTLSPPPARGSASHRLATVCWSNP